MSIRVEVRRWLNGTHVEVRRVDHARGMNIRTAATVMVCTSCKKHGTQAARASKSGGRGKDGRELCWRCRGEWDSM